MCGINGIALSSNSRRELTASTVERMRDLIVHRGPDDAGLFIAKSAKVGLGHRRLSIVDVTAGHQPMSNEDGSLQIIFNGEIYNHADHRPILKSLGHVYSTNSDTETILHLYEEHGYRCVDHLRGMFAFAIWDERKSELFIARDRLGVKPLYYAHTDDGSIYFGSEIKILLEASAVKPEINYEVLPDYLANHAPSGEHTLYRGIKRLLPGHTLTWRDGRMDVDEYWDLDFGTDDGTRSDREYVNEWTDLFEESVRLRLMADVPLGMFLSGGIDSSAIAAVMSRMVSEPIKTFSVGFAEREANELEYARIVARTFRTDHHEVVVTPQQFFSALPNLVWHEDEPIAHPSSVPLYFVSKLASEHVKVVLTGEGSDEMLGGYARYRKTLINLSFGRRYQELLPGNVRSLVSGAIKELPYSSYTQKLARSFLALPPDIESIYFDNFAVFPRAMQSQLMTAETVERVTGARPYSVFHGALAKCGSTSLLNQLLYADTKTYLQELLMKQDQMSMAASIESRVPFLDHRLVEFTARLPERMKIRGGKTKYVLRESMKGVLPEPILSRPKMGFPVPIGAWFRGSFKKVVDEYVLSERALQRRIFDRAFVRSLVKRHDAGEDHAERLWSLVNFEIWQRQFFDLESPMVAEEYQLELAHV
ncbi:MAG TPA: asparagine synthase (glutamine-hydrolyzing) [Pyrinomonadaceae bacterium]|nr:asparagine synthase (glutamine-hydrolyzing) [Pyrinomonadaceae bacterium]